MQEGGSLSILGDSRAGDDIRIVDHGGGSVDVACSDSAGSYAGVTRIDLRTGAGDDHIDYEAQIPLGDRPADLFADTGAGNDDVTFIWFENPPREGDRSVPPVPDDRPVFFDISTGDGADTVTANLDPILASDFHFRADTGAGDDAVTINWGVPPDPDRSQPPPDSDRSAFIWFDTGDGNDMLTANLQPVPQDNFHFAADLGSGDDTFNTVLASPGPCMPGQTPGTFGLAVQGGDGNDTLNTVLVPNTVLVAPGPCMPVQVSLDGGSGDDTMNVNVVPGVEINAPLTMNLDGGRDDDNIGVNFGNPPAGDRSAPIPPVQVNAPLSVNLDGGEGSDMIAANLLNPMVNAGGQIMLRADGGAGNDFLRGDIQPCVMPAGVMDVTLDGGAGDDTLIGLLDGDNEIGGAFSMQLTGGAGNDSLDGEIQPCIRPAGSVDVLLDGGAGDDMVTAQLTIPDDTAMGQVRVHALGGSGDDTLTFVVNGNLSAVSADLLVDGGSGFDTAIVSPGVRVIRCERVIYLRG